MSSTPFPLKAKIALISFGLLFGLVIGEFALGLLNAPPAGTEFGSWNDVRKAMMAPETEGDTSGVSLRAIIAPHSSDRIIYDLRPNLDVKFQGVPVKTNSCAMRGPEISLRKAPGVYRIAIIGDSFTFGWGVEQKEIFAQVLEDNLNRSGEGSMKFEVLNFGVPGYSTFQQVAKFRESGLDYDPDAVLVFFIENDFALPFYVRDVYQPNQILASSQFVRLGQKLLDPKIEEQEAQLQGFDPNSAIQELADLTGDNGIKLFFTINPKKGWKRHRNKLWVLRERRDITFVNLYHEMKRVITERGIDKKDLSLPTDPHPSALKHRLLGDLLTPYFMEVLP